MFYRPTNQVLWKRRLKVFAITAEEAVNVEQCATPARGASVGLRVPA
jgi:hypothetical protein